MKAERLSRKVHRTRGETRSGVFDYIKCFYHPVRKHSKLALLSQVGFEQGLMGQANRPGTWVKLMLLVVSICAGPIHASPQGCLPMRRPVQGAGLFASAENI